MIQGQQQGHLPPPQQQQQQQVHPQAHLQGHLPPQQQQPGHLAPPQQQQQPGHHVPPQQQQLQQPGHPQAHLLQGHPQLSQQPGIPVNGPIATPQMSSMQRLAMVTEQTWVQVGNVAEAMNDRERAQHAYECALHHNPYSLGGLLGLANSFKNREMYPKAIEFYQRALNVDTHNGELWGSLGYCYVMVDELGKAYSAYQQGLHHLSNPKDPKLWYGIGILYDRCGSHDQAEEAFTAVLKMDHKFEKASEVYFRLGMIYKYQKKYSMSIDCFRFILENPPKPLTGLDLWFQIGHVHECQKDFVTAKEIYEKILKENPRHIKTKQQLGWVYQQNGPLRDSDLSIDHLKKVVDIDQNDPYSWYMLGRSFALLDDFGKAYEGFQQAVYRDGRNPLYWCSIGVLYFKITQYRDALDAYSRAIHINPYIKEVWWNLGVLYETCNNQYNDAADAYQRAFELDSQDKEVQERLAFVKSIQNNGGNPPQGVSMASPNVRDIDPNVFHASNPQAKIDGKPIGNPPNLGAGSIFPLNHSQSNQQQQTNFNPPNASSRQSSGTPTLPNNNSSASRKHSLESSSSGGEAARQSPVVHGNQIKTPPTGNSKPHSPVMKVASSPSMPAVAAAAVVNENATSKPGSDETDYDKVEEDDDALEMGEESSDDDEQ